MDPESLAQAKRFAEDVSAQVLDWTWRAFDSLSTSYLSQLDVLEPVEQMERDLTSKHFMCITRLWAHETGGFSSVCPVHEHPENETRPPAPGKPPAYDLAFVWQENQRVAWPIEAKVLRTPKAIGEYMGDVQKFLIGTAAPLVGQGGLIAYLLTGAPTAVFAEIERRMTETLEVSPAFSSRAHRISFHSRRSAPNLCLHHMVMHCAVSLVANGGGS